jgi:hypothetical protein
MRRSLERDLDPSRYRPASGRALKRARYRWPSPGVGFHRPNGESNNSCALVFQTFFTFVGLQNAVCLAFAPLLSCTVSYSKRAGASCTTWSETWRLQLEIHHNFPS